MTLHQRKKKPNKAHAIILEVSSLRAGCKSPSVSNPSQFIELAVPPSPIGSETNRFERQDRTHPTRVGACPLKGCLLVMIGFIPGLSPNHSRRAPPAFTRIDPNGMTSLLMGKNISTYNDIHISSPQIAAQHVASPRGTCDSEADLKAPHRSWISPALDTWSGSPGGRGRLHSVRLRASACVCVRAFGGGTRGLHRRGGKKVTGL